MSRQQRLAQMRRLEASPEERSRRRVVGETCFSPVSPRRLRVPQWSAL